MSIIVTGMRTRLAQMTATALASQDMDVLGIDSVFVDLDHPNIQCLQIEANSQALGDVFALYAPQTLIHLDQPGEEHERYPEAAERAGQLQTIELLGLCASQGVEHVVLRSSTMLYGASPSQPLFVAEDRPLAEIPSGILADYLAIERFAASFVEQKSMAITIMRCAGLVGSQLGSPLARYLRMTQPPMLSGFAPRIQALHIQDAALAFALAAMRPPESSLRVFNVAADTPIPLDMAIRRAGRKPHFLPGIAFSQAHLAHSLKITQDGSIPFTLDMLRYGGGVATERIKAELGWMAHFDSAEAIASLNEE